MKRINGFSLMEMMIVLMIVAIVMAASAPMITKKTARTNSSPWIWNGNNIQFNQTGDNNRTAVIGANRIAAKRALFHLQVPVTGMPHISFGHGNDATYLTASDANNNIWLSNDTPADDSRNSVVIGNTITSKGNSYVAIGNTITRDENSVGNNSVAIGNDISVNDENSIVIGSSSSQANKNSIAIGRNARATGENSIAIGTPNGNDRAEATNQNSIAIGHGAFAKGRNAVAIGMGAHTSIDDSIVLGRNIGNTNNEEMPTVIVAGNLVVMGNTLLGGYSNSTTYIREQNGANHYIYKFRSGRAGDGKAFQGDLIGDVQIGRRKYCTDGSNSYKDGSETNEQPSDRRLKNIGKAFTGGLTEIKKLEVFNYTFKDDKSKTPRVGVMAQDLQKVFPKAVTKGDDGYLRIRMEDMFYAVVNAVKELDGRVSKNSKRIEELEKQNKEFEKLNKEFKKQNEELLKRLEALEKTKR